MSYRSGVVESPRLPAEATISYLLRHGWNVTRHSNRNVTDSIRDKDAEILMKPTTSAGGWKAIGYTLQTANRVGWMALWRAMRSNNACKTCALGMGGQMGGMVNEAGHFPEVCKKSLQAMAADMQNGISPAFFSRYSIAQLRSLSPRELESCGRLVDPIYAGPGETHYRVVPWTEALDRLATTLKTSGPARSFFYASGRSSTEAGCVLTVLARAVGVH